MGRRCRIHQTRSGFRSLSHLEVAAYGPVEAQAREKLEQVAGKIEEIAFSDAYRTQVQRFSCFRGISTLSAMILIYEISYWRPLGTLRSGGPRRS
jgi:hypothetical protein